MKMFLGRTTSVTNVSVGESCQDDDVNGEIASDVSVHVSIFCIYGLNCTCYAFCFLSPAAKRMSVVNIAVTVIIKLRLRFPAFRSRKSVMVRCSSKF